MEHGVHRVKAVITAFVVGLMMCAAASPALAQASATAGDASATGGAVNIQYQVCVQVIEQYANANQNNSGGGDSAAIAQDLGITQNAVNACIQNAPPDGTTTDPTPVEPTPVEPTPVEVTPTVTQERGERIVLSANLPTVLANTGGEAAPPGDPSSFASKAATLLPAGALLAVLGATMLCARSWRR